MLVGEHAQFVGARHASGVLLTDDPAQHTSRVQAGESGKVDRGLGVPWPAKHAAVLGPQRHDMPWAGEVDGRRVRVGEHSDRARSVASRNPGRDAFARVDGDGVRGAAAVLVGVVHRRQVEPISVGLGERHADVARGVAHHERQQLRSRHLGGED